MNNTEANEIITATEYFEGLKERKKKITDKELDKIYENCLRLMDKYVSTGQHSGAKKLMFHIDMIEKEHKIIKAGVDTFVYREDIEYYIDNIAADTVKIIELKRFEREIPDEVVEEYAKVKELFDEFYIVFTDYTGKEQQKALKERKEFEKEKDPILFGVLKSEEAGAMVNRFYWIGDWEDEYCDLTLDKMVTEYNNAAPEGKVANVVHKASSPQNVDELRMRFKIMDEEISKKSPGDRRFVVAARAEEVNESNSNNKNFFGKMKTFFRRG